MSVLQWRNALEGRSNRATAERAARGTGLTTGAPASFWKAGFASLSSEGPSERVFEMFRGWGVAVPQKQPSYTRGHHLAIK